MKIERTQLNKGIVDAIDARSIHKELKVQSRFNDWIVAKINKIGLKEGIDFSISTNIKGEGRPLKDYSVEVKAALRIVMMESGESANKLVSKLSDWITKTSVSEEVKDLKYLAKELEAAMKMAKTLGYSGEEAKQYANKMVKDLHGVSILALK